MRARFRHKIGMAKTKSISVPGSLALLNERTAEIRDRRREVLAQIEAEKAGI
ncbi:hypothetical protein DBIPINDM_008149 (plasmid) [Mesorhizobium sp. AR02]|uniref:hypothetical protein n=1 Tax=Mesorhizobium sp. AR02 TaxID=2865837 RepID=UPI00215FFF76|nr:hypothetical protein [Mesorhizobium sp. AR02]UVK57554.1 hypothetical protein DBIPINDM_008149 [Mesorhizobium sp. AR02]